MGGDSFAITNSKGTFAGRIVRELMQPYGWAVRVPTPFYFPADQAEAPQGMPPRGSGNLALPVTILLRGVDIKGSVRDENNKPVARAEVEAIWMSGDEMVQTTLTRTDQTGSFTLTGVDPLAELNLIASNGFTSTDTSLIVRAEAASTRPISLTTSIENTMSIDGRIVDPAGKPIAGASIRIWRQVQAKNGRLIVVDLITASDGSTLLHSDSDGRYHSPIRLPILGKYFAEAVAPGRLAARSRAITLSRQDHELPIMVLCRVRTLDGRIIDRQGKPVDGAVVRQAGDGPLPTRTSTNEQGQFQLEGIVEGPVLLFAEKEGFRFHFQPIDEGFTPVEFVLTRLAEPPAVLYQTLSSVLPIDEEKALSRRVFQPYAEKVSRQGSDAEKYRYLTNAISIDLLVVIERLDTFKFSDTDYLNFAGLLSGNPGQGEPRRGNDLDRGQLERRYTAQSYVGICDVGHDLGSNRIKELLAQVTLNARGVKSPTDRLALNARIADHWLNLGETKRARVLLDEGLGLDKNTAKGIKNGGYNLGLIAEPLARIDLPTALKLLDDLASDVRKNEKRDRSYVFDRFHGRIAYKLAAQSPADAERVLERLPLIHNTDQYTVVVCSRMAPIDLPRARRIAKKRISPDASAYGPYALGLMAQALASTDNPTARGLIDDAYSALEQLAANGQQFAHPGVVEV